MGNQWNDFGEGLIKGATSLAQGIIQRGYKTEAQEELNTYKKSLIDSYNNLLQKNQALIDNAHTQINPEGDLEAKNVKAGILPESTMQAGKNPLEGYEKLIQLQNNLIGNPYGEQVSQQAANMYKILGMQTQPDYDLREVSGSLIAVDKNNPANYKVVYNNPKPEKEKKKTSKQYSEMSLEDALNLPPDEVENAFFYFSPAVQGELKKNPYFQQMVDKVFKEGDFASRKLGGRRGSLGSFSFGKMTPEALSGLTPEGLENKTKNQLDQLWEDRDALSAETFDALAEKLGKPMGRGESGDEGRTIEKQGSKEGEPQFQEDEISQRRAWYEDYERQLATALEQGGYDDVKHKFWEILDYDLRKGVITQEEYNFWKAKYY